MQLQHMNLTKGIFQSYMIVDVSCEERSQSMLNWRNSLTVYKKGEKLLDVVDVVNGYFSESSKSYTLQIPFLKNFFIGYIGFLINGGAITPEEDLKIVQIIYSNIKNEDMNFNLERSQIRAYIVHELNMAGTSGNSKIDIVNVHEVYKSPAPQPEVPVEIDDNETVLADSSPYKMSPNSSRSWDTPSKSRLKIDASQKCLTIKKG
ncbi:hypothetical protein K4I79_005750 [Candida tropicalis]